MRYSSSTPRFAVILSTKPFRAASVLTLTEGSARVREYITTNDLGSSQWSGGQVRQAGEVVARISYNGRIWDNNGAEIVAAPLAPLTTTGNQALSAHINAFVSGSRRRRCA